MNISESDRGELDMKMRVNKVLIEMAAGIGLSQADVDDCALRWMAAHGVDIRDPLPENMSSLADDMLYLTCLKRILETYKGLRKTRRG